MSPEALRERAAALRREGAALRRRPAQAVHRALAAVLERWRDPNGPERRRLEAELPGRAGFSPEVVREGLARGLAPWSGESFLALARGELGLAPGCGDALTAVLLAGAIPLPTLIAVIAPLAVRSPVLAKTASRDPLTAHLVAESIAAVDAALGRCVAVVDFESADGACLEAFLSADCIVATGSAATMEAVAAGVAPPRRLLRHGHGASLALLGPEATAGAALEEAARGLALDTALWDQQGCLSPLAVYVAGDSEACRRVAEALAAALGEAGRRLPRGAVEPAAAALAAHERSSAELRAVAGRPVALLAGADWTVVREADAAPRPAPLHRFLRVHPLPAGGLDEALVPWRPHLSGAAVAGFGARAGEVETRLRAAGATRICPPGALQAPPLGWPRDGLPVLASLLGK